MQGYWDGSTKDNGRGGLVIEAVDREKRITIIKIAVPKKACTTLAAETAGASKKLVLRTYCWEVIRTILDATSTKDNRRQGAMRTLVCSCDLPLGRRRRARAKQGDIRFGCLFFRTEGQSHVLAPTSSTFHWRPALQVASLSA